MGIQVPADGDIAPVPNLLREVGSIENILRLEKSVGAGLRQEAEVESEVEVRQSLVEEAAGELRHERSRGEMGDNGTSGTV